MKYILVLVLAAALFGSAYAISFGDYTSKTQCEFNSGSWCYRCSGIQGNAFGKDACVGSTSSCTYSCDKACGAGCASNADCKNNLTEDSCQYSGSCSSCNCNYLVQECPHNGTVKQGVCYYGKRECSSSGCALSKCTLAQGQFCDPDKGCTPGAGAGSTGEYYTDYKCEGDRVFAKKNFYTCNGTGCIYSKYDAFIEKCENGCDSGKCNDVICKNNGVETDCNKFDGYYDDRFCVGNDVYQGYRDYYCSGKECSYIPKQVKQVACLKCEDGKCVVPTNEPPVVMPTNPTTNTNPGTPANQPAASLPNVTYHTGGRAYNGALFGYGEVTVQMFKGRSGRIEFTVADTNQFGTLSVISNGKLLFSGKPTKGKLSIQFTNAGNTIRFATTSSGFIFFAPAIYDVKYISVFYGK